MASFAQEYSGGLTASVIGHGLLLLLFSFNLINLDFEQTPVTQLPIEAMVIDISDLREQREAAAREQQEQERRQQAAAEEKRRQAAEQQQVAERRKQEQDQQRIADQKRQAEAEKQKVAEEKRRQADAEKQKVAEQKRKAEAERQRIAEQKRKAEEARIAEQKRKEEAARVAEQKRQAEMARLRQSEIAAEESRMAAISAGKLDIYAAQIKDRVERNWIKPASAGDGIKCEVVVTQIPGGEIVNVRIGQCNGDAAVVRSIEAAVYRSSPLPPPPDPSLFERTLRFNFKPEE